LILERVTGISFNDLLYRRVLDPLGMKDSGMDQNDLAQLGGATGYLRHAGPRYTLGAYIFSSGINGTRRKSVDAIDLYKWN